MYYNLNETPRIVLNYCKKYFLTEMQNLWETEEWSEENKLN